MAASISLLHQTFDDARKRHDRAVVVLQQADMFDPTYTPAPTDISAFQPFVQASSTRRTPSTATSTSSTVTRTSTTRPPVGARVGVADAVRRDGSAAGLERITVDGSDNNKDWLKVTVNRPGAAAR